MATKKIAPVSVPTSLAEASVLIAKIGQCERDLTELNSGLEAEIAKAREEINLLAGPIESKKKAYEKALKTYATKNRTSLLTEGKKSLVVPGGEFGWRLPPTKVTYGKGGAEQAIKNLQGLKLVQYLRIVTEVDREALLRDRPAVSGINYVQKEIFYVKPESEKAPDTFPGAAAKK